jgi:hypothetical protein
MFSKPPRRTLEDLTDEEKRKIKELGSVFGTPQMVVPGTEAYDDFKAAGLDPDVMDIVEFTPDFPLKPKDPDG